MSSATNRSVTANNDEDSEFDTMTEEQKDAAVRERAYQVGVETLSLIHDYNPGEHRPEEYFWRPRHGWHAWAREMIRRGIEASKADNRPTASSSVGGDLPVKLGDSQNASRGAGTATEHSNDKGKGPLKVKKGAKQKTTTPDTGKEVAGSAKGPPSGERRFAFLENPPTLTDPDWPIDLDPSPGPEPTRYDLWFGKDVAQKDCVPWEPVPLPDLPSIPTGSKMSTTNPQTNGIKAESKEQLSSVGAAGSSKKPRPAKKLKLSGGTSSKPQSKPVNKKGKGEMNVEDASEDDEV